TTGGMMSRARARYLVTTLGAFGLLTVSCQMNSLMPVGPPQATAGPDRMVGIHDTVQLDGRMSLDPFGAGLNYLWSFVTRRRGSTATLSGATNSMPTFVAEVGGTYTVKLVVTDSELMPMSSSATVTLTAIPRPTAVVPKTFAVYAGDTAVLTATSSGAS